MQQPACFARVVALLPSLSNDLPLTRDVVLACNNMTLGARQILLEVCPVHGVSPFWRQNFPDFETLQGHCRFDFAGNQDPTFPGPAQMGTR